MRLFLRLFSITVLCLFALSCSHTINNEAGLDPSKFETELDGKEIHLFVLRNNNGLEMTVTNYGAKVVSLMVADKNGKKEDVVLGYDNIDDYIEKRGPFFGAVIGRYAGRIAKGRFMLDGKEYTLETNNGSNHLHGGVKGFDAVVWDVEQLSSQKIEFDYLSEDGEEGYPGNLSVRMSYELTDKNEFVINYEAVTDKPTPINLTHHSFFNLHGAGNGSVADHVLYINAAFYTPFDQSLIPSGEIAPLAGTPLDFSEPTTIGERIDDDYPSLKLASGYDHNYVLNQLREKEMNLAASVYEPKSGRFIEVYTDQPGLQFFTANFLNPDVIGKQGKVYDKRSAFCLETQHFPDSPNKPNFPNTILNVGDIYTHTCIYKFGIK